jgi:hypothetical protein
MRSLELGWGLSAFFSSVSSERLPLVHVVIPKAYTSYELLHAIVYRSQNTTLQ